MAWNPAVTPDEVVLVACNLVARRGVPFNVVLTDQRLIRGRSTMWAVDGRVTDSYPLSEIHGARLVRALPIGLWLFGSLAALGFVTALFGAFTGAASGVSWFMGVAMLAASAISFGGARKRVALRWRGAARRRSIVTPVGSHDGVRTHMADALREIERLLSDRNRLALQAREMRLALESEQDRGPHDDHDDDARTLCADGNCTGVVGADGRCRICGLAS